MARNKENLPDESIQVNMAIIEREIAFHQECITALQQIQVGYERILELRRKERERQAARVITVTTETVAADVERAGER